MGHPSYGCRTPLCCTSDPPLPSPGGIPEGNHSGNVANHARRWRFLAFRDPVRVQTSRYSGQTELAKGSAPGERGIRMSISATVATFTPSRPFLTTSKLNVRLSVLRELGKSRLPPRPQLSQKRPGYRHPCLLKGSNFGHQRQSTKLPPSIAVFIDAVRLDFWYSFLPTLSPHLFSADWCTPHEMTRPIFSSSRTIHFSDERCQRRVFTA